MKNSLSRRLFQKYGLPPRGYQWGATSFLPTQGTLTRPTYTLKKADSKKQQVFLEETFPSLKKNC